jgi:hypothetical protein
LRDAPSKEKLLTFKRGHDIGEIAHQLFPGGIDVTSATKNLEAALELTTQLVLQKEPVIYEATFLFKQTLVMVDILEFKDDKWIAYEVKSSLKIGEHFVKDASLQYYVLKNVLPSLADFFLVNLNGDYQLNGELNVRELFKKRSIRKTAEENESFFSQKIDAILLLLERNSIPDIPAGRHCFSPYPCDFLSTC